MGFLTRLGHDVQIHIASRPSGRRPTAIQVLKGMIKAPSRPVTVEDMRRSVARRAAR
jgi:hypothetical protein